MPLPLVSIAIPVLHSSGAWIASTTASGYIASTLSSTWIGAFVLGNSKLLGGFVIGTALGIFGATGSLAALASSTALSIGAGLTAIGLGGLARFLGIAPEPNFLGFTLTEWAVALAILVFILTLGLYVRNTRKIMKRINEEREKGGLGPISITQIVKEARLFEAQSLEAILKRPSFELDAVQLSSDRKEVSVDGQLFSVHRLKYLVSVDGSEELVFVNRAGRKKRLLLIKPTSNPDGQPS